MRAEMVVLVNFWVVEHFKMTYKQVSKTYLARTIS